MYHWYVQMLIYSLIILPVGVLNFLFKRLKDDDDDDEGIATATITCVSNVCTFFLFFQTVLNSSGRGKSF